jgi:hypothetical protein
MKSKQTMALLFWRFMRKMRKEDGKVPIYARITIDGKSKEISTGVWCLPERWDNKAKMISALDKSASAANLRPAQVKSESESHFLVLCSTRPLVTVEMLKDVYEGGRHGQLRLSAYVNDGTLNIDNNPMENSIRPVALGRKNYLFAGSHEAAKRSAMLYSLLGTARMHGIEPYTWLKEVLRRIADYPVNKVAELLPHRCKK